VRGFVGFCLAERQHSAKKVEESRSFSTGVTSQAALSGDQPLAAVRITGWELLVVGPEGLPKRGEVSVLDSVILPPLSLSL